MPDENEDEDKPYTYEPSLFEKIINILLCRPDLAKQTLTAKPVSILGLVTYNFATYEDQIFSFVMVKNLMSC
jgi:hypothetical protein